MKRFFAIAVVVWMMFILPGTVYADSVQQFREVYESTESLTHNFFKNLSLANSCKQAGREALLKIADHILFNARDLERLALKQEKKMCADEAALMHEYMSKIKKIIMIGDDNKDMAMLVAKFYMHYNNCLMLNSENLKLMLSDHMKALKEHGPSPVHRRSFRPVREADS